MKARKHSKSFSTSNWNATFPVKYGQIAEAAIELFQAAADVQWQQSQHQQSAGMTEGTSTPSSMLMRMSHQKRCSGRFWTE